MNALRTACRNALRNARRSVVTLLIATVSTVAVMSGGGFALYTYDSLREQTARDVGHVIVASHDYFDRQEERTLQYGLDDVQALRTRLLRDDRVRAVLPRVQLAGLVSNAARSAVAIGAGVDSSREFLVKGPFLKVTEGEVLDAIDASTGAPQILLGKDLARTLSAHPGGRLTLMATTTEGTLNAVDVVVRGVVSVGVPQVDATLVLVDLATAQSLLLTQRVSSLAVHLKDMDATDRFAQDLRRDHADLAVRTWHDQAFFYDAVRSLYNRIFGLLGSIIILIVGFAMFNTIGMAVVERTREIGALRAMGAFPGRILQEFTWEGVVIAAAGAGVGVLVSVAISLALVFFPVQMPPPPGSSVGYPFEVDLDPVLTAVAVAGVIALSALGALLASYRAVRRPIVESLNHV